MRHRKLRSYVMPALYVIILMLVFGAVSLVSTLMKSNPTYLYAIGLIKDREAIPVVGGDNLPDVVIKPFAIDASIATYFYDKDGTKEEQEKALIYYQNTYMKNTGVLYNAKDAFDIIMPLDGKIINIKEDEILGKYIEVEHNTNLRTVYYSVDDIKVKVGDELKQGEIIAKSGSNKISENKNNLLFEVYYNGTLINPEEFYNMSVDELN